MYEFKAELIDSRTIEIVSNTYWSCRAEGNFKLSKYSGENNSTIKVEIPDDIIFAIGTVYFSYGDERCEYPEINVYSNNSCYMKTFPDYVMCDEKKTVNFYYNNSQQLFTASVFCFDGWEVTNSGGFSYITNNNEITIMSSNNDGTLIIEQKGECENKNVLYINLIKQKEYVPPTPPQPPVIISVTGVELDKSSINLQVGGDEYLIATVLPNNASNKNVTWSSSDETVAKVNNGVVTALSLGQCEITVKTEDGGYTASCTVKVTTEPIPVVHVSNVTIANYSSSLKINDYDDINVIVEPSNADNKNVRWSSSNNNIATVTKTGEFDARVLAKAVGTCTITVTSIDNNKTDSYTLEVKQGSGGKDVTGVTLDRETLSLGVDNYYVLNATVLPTTADNKNVRWSSSNNNIATVTQDGLVFGVNTGDCSITVTTEDGGFTDSCSITVTGSSSPTPVVTDYFTIVLLNSGNIKLTNAGGQFNYSVGDGGNWNVGDASTTISASAGQKVLFKGYLIPNKTNGIGRFTISTYFLAKGNIMSLMYGDDFGSITDLGTREYAFFKLFMDCENLINASKLLLPATKLASGCYSNMFANCTNIVTSPSLPATTLTSYCYDSMFINCTSLATTPQLSATELDEFCYYSMFSNCSNIKAMPHLSAFTCKKYCYSYMFYKCSNLVTTHELPAKTLALGCYEYMFSKCTSLKNAPSLPATTLKSICYSRMFSDCKSLTATPNLPGTTLESGCYWHMFENCINLRTVSSLPATRLADSCYEGMFSGCESLNNAPNLPAKTLAEHCYSYMFYRCTNLITAPSLSATTLANYCYSYMFYGCTRLTTAPSLPATTLTNGCYDSMFSYCTSLTTAPELPATTLKILSYLNMFNGCTRLNSITCLATDINANRSTENWVNGVSSSGTFTKAPNMTSWTTGVNGIPNNWNVNS